METSEREDKQSNELFERKDELVVVCKDNPKAVEEISNMIKDSIVEVSRKYKLRRELGCDVQTGDRYSNIH